jgi:hypothetical protein
MQGCTCDLGSSNGGAYRRQAGIRPLPREALGNWERPWDHRLWALTKSRPGGWH